MADAENVKVVVRCRPINTREKQMNCNTIVTMLGCNRVQLTNPTDIQCPPKMFTFDSVYDSQSSTENLYNDICYPLIESVLDGYNATIFAYGQTGCGKSFTMEGPSQLLVEANQNSFSVDNNVTKGVIPRSFEHIFEAISVATEVKYLALVSYLEIYNEQIRDLLEPSSKLSNNMAGLPLKEIPNEGVVIQGLTTHPVHNVEECQQLLNLGSKNRIIGATLMNQSSSRSHSIFTISLEQIRNNNDLPNLLQSDCIKKGKLNLVDLAGSERQAKTGATGDRLKEATKINLSLSALGNVISALVDGKSKHIPYRDSKLTRLLQDSLGGNTRTLMIACVSPADNNYDETLSTLRYANRAKNISNKPIVNEDPKDATLRKYQEEIEKLKELLQHNNVPVADNNLINSSINNNEFDKEKSRIITEYEEEMMQLKHAHENEKNQKETLMQEMQQLRQQYEIKLRSVSSSTQPISNEVILQRLQALKASMIGGEKANDVKLKEKYKKKKIAAERKLSALAQVLARVDQDEDREMLEGHVKDFTQELTLKTDLIKKYKHKVKALEREILDIQQEFEAERTDYLETIRKHEKTIKLLSQINDKMVPVLKKECNYSDLENIKLHSIWIDDLQKWKLPDVIIYRTKLPPAGGVSNVSQTAPARLENDSEKNKSSEFSSPGNSTISLASSSDGNDIEGDFLMKKLVKSEKENVTSNYFKPRRATQLLNPGSSSYSTLNSNTASSRAFNAWRGMEHITFRSNNHRISSASSLASQSTPAIEISNLSNTWNHFPSGSSANIWVNDLISDTNRKPQRLDALPHLQLKRETSQLNNLDPI